MSLLAVKKFLELKHARDVLLDPKKKEQYDKKLSQELMAKKKQREREAELDSKRRQMRDGTSNSNSLQQHLQRPSVCNGWFCVCVCVVRSCISSELLRKEQSHDLKHKQKKEGGQYRKSDLTKLREKGLARQKEMEERLARDARRREELDQLKETLAASTYICLCTWVWMCVGVKKTDASSLVLFDRIIYEVAAHRHFEVGSETVFPLG